MAGVVGASGEGLICQARGVELFRVLAELCRP